MGEKEPALDVDVDANVVCSCVCIDKSNWEAEGRVSSYITKLNK